jgi:dCTP deaminase
MDTLTQHPDTTEGGRLMYGILSDKQIEDYCTGRGNMISPFERDQIREIENPVPVPFGKVRSEIDEIIKAISFGSSSYGYDLRLSPNKFKVFHNALGNVLVDPKNFDERLLVEQQLTVDHTGSWFVVPGNSYALAETVEYIRMPRSMTVISVGKSTYARCGIITNVTPFEAGWDGVVTLELANACPAPVKVYANEGICQSVFFEGAIWPRVTYADRAGKYQGQTGLTLARV